MTVEASSIYVYSVYESEKRYIVELESGTCNCARFQIDQIPCAHAIAVLKSKHVKEFGEYCSEYYKPNTFVKTYEVPIVPMPDKKDWDAPSSEEEVLPPIYKKPPERSKKVRKKKSSETLSSSTNRYGRCSQEGHTRRSCSFFSKEK
ncbi:hypothetical protein P3L10_021772 [Capsicum annuum]